MTPIHEENVRYLRELIDQHQEATHAEVTRPALALGSAMIVMGTGLVVGGLPFAFALTCLVWGAIIATASLVTAIKTQRHRTEQLEVLCQALSDQAAGVA